MDENENNAAPDIFEQARITKENEPKAEGAEKELLVFGEGGGQLSKDGGVRYTKPKFGYFIIAGLVGVILGTALTLLMVSRIAGGLSNLRLISYMGKYDSSVISELLARIEAVHFGETPDSQTLIDKASHALVDAMEDPYASYYTDEEYNSYSSSFNGNYYGIGILVQNPDGTGALIRRVYEGSFAEQAGLMKDDLIIRVDGEDITETIFGTARMLEALNGNPDAAPEQILKNVSGAVDGFVNGAEQFDDVTMLCMEYRGKGKEGD